MGDLCSDAEGIIQQLVATDADLPGSCSHAARELVGKLFAHLKADERLVLTLLHLEEKSVDEICEITGWSRTATKVRAFRARHKMRRLWKTVLKGEWN